MSLIYAEYNPQTNSIDVTTFALDLQTLGFTGFSAVFVV